MEIKYSGSISYDIDSVMGLFTDNTMSDDDIREILYGDFCAYDDFEYSILCSEINQVLAEVRSRIGEQMTIEGF